LVTFGMMTLMTAGGALSGYLFRARREVPVLHPADDSDLSDSSSPRIINESPTPLNAPQSDKVS
nr:hypothetical protein [Gammaproteobacteria bacterium]